MLDFAWSELLVVIAVAVLVIGPKDIPKVMRGLGQLMRRVQYLRFALSQQFEDLMKETDLEELRQMNKEAAQDQPETDEAAADQEEEEREDDRDVTTTTRH
ncbi:MAG: Sec-independent protein translocase subunit TatA/TatB [Micavibrio sp.]